MSDLISRQAAIEINRSYHGQMPNEVNYRIWKELNALPSAQPEQKTGRWIPKFDGQFKGGAYWFYCSEYERVVPDVRNGGRSFCP